MNLREFVVKEYQATVRNTPTIPDELRQALAANERVPAFMDSICKQLSAPAFKNSSNNDLREIIKNSTLFFLELVKQKAAEKMMSEVEKMAIKQKIDDDAIINKACDTGIIDEEVTDVLKRRSFEEAESKKD